MNDEMALAAIEVVQLDFGLEIGRQIGIAGFDDVAEASWRSFDLTTYRFPVQAIVDKVVSLLMAKPDFKNPVDIIVDGALMPRGSSRRKPL